MPIIIGVLLVGTMLALELFVDQENEESVQRMKTGMLILLPVVIGILVSAAILL